MNLKKILFTNHRNYTNPKHINPVGIMVHDTGAENAWLKRYVAPDDGTIGKNKYNNDWNRAEHESCVHAFIGKLQDGTIATVQVLPFTYRAYHCGVGTSGFSANNTHISFEICRDIDNAEYFNKVYLEAVEFCAYLCKKFGLDPLEDGVLICHCEGYQRGVAGNHADVMEWFPIYGKSMDTFRLDVHNMLEDDNMTQEQFDSMLENYIARQQAKPASAWAVPYIQKAIDNGVMTDVNGSISAPQAYITREEIAVVASAILERND